MMKLIARLQPMGRALMLPIAVLPVAALLLRLGQDDMFNLPAMAAAGQAIFDNLGILFAIGVAVGLAKENHGAAGLAAVVGYVVATQGAKALIDLPVEEIVKLVRGLDAAELIAASPEVRGLATGAAEARIISIVSVPVGLLSGLFAGWAFNRYGDIRLPAYLAFFGGRRFIPIMSGLGGVVMAFAIGYGWSDVKHGMDEASAAVLGSQEYGLFTYGVLNRALIVTGLHHIINNLAWFNLGEYQGATGDLKRFFAGDPSAGAFMSGFFPVMMFGLPGACLAMYRTALPEKRAAVGGLLLSMALTSFLTGVTEPIEFAFMFLAPVLYGVHALLTGLAMVLMHVLDVHLGFGFSAGLFDYVLNYKLSTNPLLLLPVGLGYFALYFVLFRWFILRFDLKTLGRERDEVGAPAMQAGEGGAALDWIRALGSAGNLRAVEACTTRLRLTVVDQARLDEPALKSLGSRGVLKMADGAVQVVVGPIADQLAADIRSALRGRTPMPSEPRRATGALPPSARANRGDAPALLAALGGAANVAAIEVRSTRMVITVKNSSLVNDAGLGAAGFRGVARVGAAHWHVIVGPDAPQVAAALQAPL
jgi:PTS system N-acetylglucosamine-specific IIC component